MAGELVIGGGELPPAGAELRFRDGGLPVLNANPYGKGLGGHGDPGGEEHPKGVTGRMARSQHQGIAGEIIGALRALHCQR